jgi:hypothetical protein
MGRPEPPGLGVTGGFAGVVLPDVEPFEMLVEVLPFDVVEVPFVFVLVCAHAAAQHQMPATATVTLSTNPPERLFYG